MMKCGPIRSSSLRLAKFFSVLLVRFEQVGFKDCAGSEQTDVDMDEEGKESHLAHNNEQVVGFCAACQSSARRHSKFDRR